jgi:hypothetical protein
VKALVRYGFFIAGIPNLLGFIAATALGLFLNLLFPGKSKLPVFVAVDLFSGFAAVFCGIFLLRIAGFQPEMWLPIFSAIWFAVHFWLIDGFNQFLLSIAGVVGGWLVYLFH